MDTLSLSLDPLASPNTAINTEEFHTASCSSPKPFPGSEGIASPSTGAGTTTLPSPEGTAEDRPAPPPPDFRLGPGDADDSDISSADDCRQSRVVEGQSSSSVERSPEERHQRAKYRRKISSEAKAGRRQVTEAEALRAMQRLCSRIAAQKMLVISSLENDCSKDDLNRQIAWSVIGWVAENLLSRAPPCFGRHIKPLVPVASVVVSTRVVGHGPISLFHP
ncbi:hypothetical protein evm_003237 [Chilo suppressalis]|nr:hypothetical protein evm_003237 [Chilo suppressalis]